MALAFLRRILAPLVTTHTTEPSFYRGSFAERLYGSKQRDIDAECGYPAHLEASELRRWYDQNGIARRIVECLPNDTWQVAPEVYESEQPEETPFEHDITALAESLGLWDVARVADILAGIGRYGVLLFGFDDGAALSEPVATGRRTRLLYARAFDETYAEIVERDTDPQSARYGLPTVYRLRFADLASGAETTQRVHWTRCVHIADGRDVSLVYGTPRLQPVIHRLYDLRKLLSGSAEMYWRGAFPGYSFEISPDVAQRMTDDQVERTKQQVESWMIGLQRYVALAGITVKSIAPQVVDPTSQVEAQLRAIAVALAIPWRILFGAEQAQLASEQDTLSWARRVRGRQYGFATRSIILPIIDTLVRAGAVAPPTDTVRVYWPDIVATPPAAQANMAAQITAALSQYVQAGLDQLIEPKAYLVHVLGLDVEVADALLAESSTTPDIAPVEEEPAEEQVAPPAA